MTVGIIAFERAMVEPQDFFQAESFGKISLNPLPSKIPVAVRRQQAFRCRQKQSAAVAFNRTAFKNKTKTVYTFGGEHSVLGHGESDKVIAIGSELKPPAVEFKVVEIYPAVATDRSYGSEITRPRIIRREGA